jgi:hypothetical protein
MKAYIVTLREFYNGEWLDEIIFECSADDFNHAEEQALDAYPDCNVISIDIDN